MNDASTGLLVGSVLKGLYSSFEIEFICPLCGHPSGTIGGAVWHFFTHCDEEQVRLAGKHAPRIAKSMARGLVKGKSDGKRFFSMRVRFTGASYEVDTPEELHQCIKDNRNRLTSPAPIMVWTGLKACLSVVAAVVVTLVALSGNSGATAIQNMLLLLYVVSHGELDKRGYIIEYPFSEGFALILMLVSAVLFLLYGMKG